MLMICCDFWYLFSRIWPHVGAFVVVASSIAWFILKATVGIRIDEADEVRGSDMTECGMEAYPEFGRGSKTM